MGNKQAQGPLTSIVWGEEKKLWKKTIWLQTFFKNILFCVQQMKEILKYITKHKIQNKIFIIYNIFFGIDFP